MMWSSRPLYDGRYLAATPPLPRSVHWDDIALLVARLTLAALFLPSGVHKLLHMEQFVALLAQYDLFGHALPRPKMFAGIAVVVELGGGIMLLLGLFTRWAALALVAFVIVATAASHRYWEYSSAPERQAEQVEFQANIAIAAGLLALSVAGGGFMGLDRRRRSF
jgi:putative oxidoreductase